MPSSKQTRVKKIKAWAVAHVEKGLMDDGVTYKEVIYPFYPMFRKIGDAREYKKSTYGTSKEFKIVPCTISFTPPSNPKKK